MLMRKKENFGFFQAKQTLQILLLFAQTDLDCDKSHNDGRRKLTQSLVQSLNFSSFFYFISGDIILMDNFYKRLNHLLNGLKTFCKPRVSM